MLEMISTYKHCYKSLAGSHFYADPLGGVTPLAQVDTPLMWL